MKTTPIWLSGITFKIPSGLNPIFPGIPLPFQNSATLHLTNQIFWVWLPPKGFFKIISDQNPCIYKSLNLKVYIFCMSLSQCIVCFIHLIKFEFALQLIKVINGFTADVPLSFGRYYFVEVGSVFCYPFYLSFWAHQIWQNSFLLIYLYI